MLPLRARDIKFSVDGFGRVAAGRFDVPGAPVALVSDGQELSNLGDSVARWSISEIHVCRSFRPTTASASRPGALSGAVNRYSREFESVQPAYVLNRPVNKRRPVNGENGEFGGLREADEPNHDG
jgi:hypothetical protein